MLHLAFKAALLPLPNLHMCRVCSALDIAIGNILKTTTMHYFLVLIIPTQLLAKFRELDEQAGAGSICNPPDGIQCCWQQARREGEAGHKG